MLCAAAAGCTEAPPERPIAPSSGATAAPPYDASLPAARAALLLAPDDATALRVVDWEIVRRDVGLPGLTSTSSEADRSTLRNRIAVAPILDRPLLEPV